MDGAVDTKLDGAVDTKLDELRGQIYDEIRSIRDPEKPQTLEELEVVREEDVRITQGESCTTVHIDLTPTVPHCHLATVIGLCVRKKLEALWGKEYKLDIYLKEGTHSAVHAVSRQINDKERIAAAMENSALQNIVQDCITELE